MGRPARLAAGAVFVLGAIAGAGVRSGASRDAFPSGAWERHRFNGGAVAVCFEGCCGSMCWPRERPATHAAAGAAARGVRGVGGFFHALGAWERHMTMVWALLPFVLKAIAGAGVRSGASRDAFPSGAWERHRFNGGAVAVCFEGCCGSMCWPRERPATHAAAGAAARGVRGIGGFFHALGAWERHMTMVWVLLPFVLKAIAGAGVRSGASRDAFPSGAWERHRFNGGAVAVYPEGGCDSERWTLERPHTAYRRWIGRTRGFDFLGLEDFVGGGFRHGDSLSILRVLHKGILPHAEKMPQSAGMRIVRR